MRFTSLVLASSLIVAAASAHISTNNGVASSSLLARDIASSSSSAPAIALQKRDDAVVEEIDVEVDDDEEEDGSLEARGKQHKKHHKKSHHRNAKHRASHKKEQHKVHVEEKHHKKPAPHHKNHSDATVATAGSGGQFHGKGTFFQPDQGACGKWNTAEDKIVALSADIYQGGSHCFKGVRICHGSKCVGAKVADLCPGCHKTSLDMTPSLFDELADPEVGVIDIQWSFI